MGEILGMKGYLIAAIILGLIMSIFILHLFEYKDTKIKNPEDIIKYLGLQVLGILPFNNLSEKDEIIEAYGSVRTNIKFLGSVKKMKTILVTSATKNEGKSSVVSNLAYSFATQGKKVLIIDGDLRTPAIHKIFEIDNKFGITDVLIGYKKFEDCVDKEKIENLHILTSGNVPPNPDEMLDSNKMKYFINKIKFKYDYIFIDSPSISKVRDAGIIGRLVDGTILVTASKEVDINLLQKEKNKLNGEGVNIIGVLLNKHITKAKAYTYRYIYAVLTRNMKIKKYENQQKNRKRKKEKRKRDIIKKRKKDNKLRQKQQSVGLVTCIHDK